MVTRVGALHFVPEIVHLRNDKMSILNPSDGSYLKFSYTHFLNSINVSYDVNEDDA